MLNIFNLTDSKQPHQYNHHHFLSSFSFPPAKMTSMSFILFYFSFLIFRITNNENIPEVRKTPVTLQVKLSASSRDC